MNSIILRQALTRVASSAYSSRTASTSILVRRNPLIPTSARLCQLYSTKPNLSSPPPTAPAATSPSADAPTPVDNDPSIPLEESAASTSPSSDAATPIEPSSVPPPQAIIPTQSLAEQYLSLTDLPPSSRVEKFPGNTTSARSRSPNAKSSGEKRRQNASRTFLFSGALSVVAGAIYLGRAWDDELEMMKMVARTDDLEGVRLAEQGGWKAFYGRARIRAASHADYFNKPAWEPLLPPALPEPYTKPYTLIIDLDDLLVHASWDTKHGWRTAKRPGVDYFLGYLSQFYEIILFTTQPNYTAEPIIAKLDPFGRRFSYKLFRESTVYRGGNLIKDLSYLGRPLEKTIMLDTVPSHISLNPSNSILLQPWQGSRNDPVAKELVALIPFLEAIPLYRVQDVRPIIQQFEGQHIPTKYAEKEAQLKQEAVEKWEKEKAVRQVKKGVMSALFGSLGAGKGPDVPETFIEEARRQYQRMYLLDLQHEEQNSPEWTKMMEEDIARQMREMPTSLIERLASFAGPPPPPPAATS